MTWVFAIPLYLGMLLIPLALLAIPLGILKGIWSIYQINKKEDVKCNIPSSEYHSFFEKGVEERLAYEKKRDFWNQVKK